MLTYLFHTGGERSGERRLTRRDGRIHKIASCYIGDVAANKKKSLVLPTLIVNLRGAYGELHSSASRSFRRRSHDSPGSSTSSAAATTTTTTLLFRPNTDEAHLLERWRREIHSRLLPPIKSIATTPDASSHFLLNGEPNTALLSPSIRSQTSTLSTRSTPTSSPPPSPRPSAPTGSAPNRRETILDRFFSSTSPTPSPETPISSMARFEALMDELDAGISLPPPPPPQPRPRRIPSPTQRALEFVTTGRAPPTADFDAPKNVHRDGRGSHGDLSFVPEHYGTDEED